MRRHTQRHANDRKSHARERKRKSFVDFRAAGAAFPCVLALELLQQLLDRQSGTARSFFLFVVQLFEADRQRAFHHVDAVVDLVEVERVFRVALLVTSPIQMHQDLFVRQIRFEHTGARVRDLHGQRLLVHLEHGNVLKFVPFLFADINPAAGKLIDDLIAAKKRHRIPRGEIKNGTAQSLLRGRRNLHIEPETNRRANNRDASKRNRHARDAHAVGAQRDQFVVRGEPSVHEQDRSQQSPRNGEDKRERQHVGDERDQVFHRHIVIHQQRQQLAENISDHEHQAQHRDGK